MIHSQDTRAFLAIFVQFPPATAKTEPGMWHHSISASPSGGVHPSPAATGADHPLPGIAGRMEKGFWKYPKKKKKVPQPKLIGVFLLLFTPSMFLGNSLPQIFLGLCDNDSFLHFAHKNTHEGRTLWWCVWRAGNSLENPTGAWELVGPSSANHGNMRSHISTKSSGGGLS